MPNIAGISLTFDQRDLYRYLAMCFSLLIGTHINYVECKNIQLSEYYEISVSCLTPLREFNLAFIFKNIFILFFGGENNLLLLKYSTT